MAATSTYTDNSTADLDRVRLEIQDTDDQRWLFTDNQINDLLLQDGNVLSAAAHAAELMAARVAREYDFSADGASFSRSQQVKAWGMLAINLRRRANASFNVNNHVTRIDGYSDDIRSDEVNVDSDATFDRSGLVD